MRAEVMHRSGLGLAVVVALMGSAAAAQAQQTGEEKRAGAVCQVKLETAAVPVQADPVVLRAVYDHAIGERISTVLQEESGVQVVKTEPDAEAPMTVRLTLNTSRAQPGEWTLSLEGEGGKCVGKVRVQPGAGGAAPTR